MLSLSSFELYIINTNCCGHKIFFVLVYKISFSPFINDFHDQVNWCNWGYVKMNLNNLITTYKDASWKQHRWWRTLAKL